MVIADLVISYPLVHGGNDKSTMSEFGLPPVVYTSADIASTVVSGRYHLKEA